MRKNILCVLLMGLLTVSLTACVSEGEMPSDAPELSRPSEAVPPSEEPSLPVEPSDPPFEIPEVEFTLPDREYEPWQTACMDFLFRLCQIETGMPWDPMADDVDELYAGLAVDERGDTAWGRPLAEAMCMGSQSEFLYDMDKDGVPELFVSYGFDEDITQCYVFRDGQMVCVGEFYTGNSVLYGHPEKSAILRHWARGGSAAVYEHDMVDGVLVEGRELLYEEWLDNFTAPDELVPGAWRIERRRTWRGEEDWSRYLEDWDDGRPHPSAGKALLLPICDWGVGPVATGNSSEAARAAILAALAGERPVYGASGDPICGDVGWTTWEEYIQPGVAYPDSDKPLRIEAHIWLDLNGDGQEECVLRQRSGDWKDDVVVLSEQAGTVYAYCFEIYGLEIYADGTIQSSIIWAHRLSFWQDQCYEYDATRGASAQPVEWIDGPPTPDAPVPTLSPDLLAALPDREYQPWQMAYMELLSLMCKAKLDYDSLTEEEKQSVYQEAIEDAAVLGIEHYYLYDIDKDGIPELLANYAVGSMVQCYTWQENRISSAGWIDICSGSLFTCPGENGILLHCRSTAGMIDTITMIFSLENGALQPKLLCSQEGTTPAVDIFWPDDLIPGAAFFGYYRICADRRTGTPLLLPVCDYYGDAPEPSQTPPEEARAEILAALAGERPLCAVSTDEYDDDTRWMTWEEYILRGAYRYSSIPYEITAHCWADLDGDGREECAVWLWAVAEEDNFYDMKQVVLSERDGAVYAYWLDPFGNCELTAEGFLYDDGEIQALSFYGEQCCLCWGVSSGQYAPVEWQDGPPVG